MALENTRNIHEEGSNYVLQRLLLITDFDNSYRKIMIEKVRLKDGEITVCGHFQHTFFISEYQIKFAPKPASKIQRIKKYNTSAGTNILSTLRHVDVDIYVIGISDQEDIFVSSYPLSED
jgi:hypothetical protein